MDLFHEVTCRERVIGGATMPWLALLPEDLEG